MVLLAVENEAVTKIVLAGVAVLIASGCVVVYRREQSRKRAAAAEQSADRSRMERAGAASAERDAVIFAQHRQINDLHIRKLDAEVALLQGQVKSRRDDEDRLHAAKEFHELTVEKTKLEIDSLRLHIAEQRKRMDDFGLGGGHG
jgi:hypothetical protein